MFYHLIVVVSYKANLPDKLVFKYIELKVIEKMIALLSADSCNFREYMWKNWKLLSHDRFFSDNIT